MMASKFLVGKMGPSKLACRFNPARNIFNSPNSNRMLEVGKFQERSTCRYEAGQSIFHEKDHYRGVILHGWPVTMHMQNQDRGECKSSDGLNKNTTLFKKKKTYYLVLRDRQDDAYINHYNYVPFQLDPNGKKYDCIKVRPSIRELPPFDYVSHEDILPYSSNHYPPIQNECFKEYFPSFQTMFRCSGNDVEYKVTLVPNKDLIRRYEKFMKISNTFAVASENVLVSAFTTFHGVLTYHEADPDTGTNLQKKSHGWRYTIRVQYLNESEDMIVGQSLLRFQSKDGVETLLSDGLPGNIKPKLSKYHQLFQFSSTASFNSPIGHLQYGILWIDDQINGTSFKCMVPSIPFIYDKEFSGNYKKEQDAERDINPESDPTNDPPIIDWTS